MLYYELFFQYFLLFFVFRNALQITHSTSSTQGTSTGPVTWSVLCLCLSYSHRLFPALTCALLPLYYIYKRTTKFPKPWHETTIHHSLSPLDEYKLIQIAFKSWGYMRTHWTQSLGPVSLSVCLSSLLWCMRI